MPMLHQCDVSRMEAYVAMALIMFTAAANDSVDPRLRLRRRILAG